MNFIKISIVWEIQVLEEVEAILVKTLVLELLATAMEIRVEVQGTKEVFIAIIAEAQEINKDKADGETLDSTQDLAND